MIAVGITLGNPLQVVISAKWSPSGRVGGCTCHHRKVEGSIPWIYIILRDGGYKRAEVGNGKSWNLVQMVQRLTPLPTNGSGVQIPGSYMENQAPNILSVKRGGYKAQVRTVES